jgi:hypothetical protein
MGSTIARSSVYGSGERGEDRQGWRDPPLHWRFLGSARIFGQPCRSWSTADSAAKVQRVDCVFGCRSAAVPETPREQTSGEEC